MKILYIDDNLSNLIAFKKILEPFFPDFITAQSGEEGIKLLYKENPDIALIDLKLPDINGFEILKNFKKDNPKSKTIFIAVSGYNDNNTIKNVYNAGFSGFIEKPVNINQIITYILSFKKDDKQTSLKQNNFKDNDKLSNANENIIWDEIINAISHDLKTPITSLLINLKDNNFNKNEVIEKINNYLTELDNILDFLKNQSKILFKYKYFFQLDEIIKHIENNYECNITYINSQNKIYNNPELIKYLIDTVIKKIILSNKSLNITLSSDKNYINFIFENINNIEELEFKDMLFNNLIKSLNARIFTDNNNLFLLIPIWG